MRVSAQSLTPCPGPPECLIGEGPLRFGGRDTAGRALPGVLGERRSSPSGRRRTGRGVQGKGVWMGVSGRDITPPPPLRALFDSETTVEEYTQESGAVNRLRRARRPLPLLLPRRLLVAPRAGRRGRRRRARG